MKCNLPAGYLHLPENEPESEFKFGVWYPIETAPKDGSWVSLYFPDFGKSSVGKWGKPCSYKEHWLIEGNITFYNPTHWMPLPPKPTE